MKTKTTGVMYIVLTSIYFFLLKTRVYYLEFSCHTYHMYMWFDPLRTTNETFETSVIDSYLNCFDNGLGDEFILFERKRRKKTWIVLIRNERFIYSVRSLRSIYTSNLTFLHFDVKWICILVWWNVGYARRKKKSQVDSVR